MPYELPEHLKQTRKEQINFQIPKFLHEMVKEEAEKKGETKSQFIRRAITARINRINKGEEE